MVDTHLLLKRGPAGRGAGEFGFSGEELLLSQCCHPSLCREGSGAALVC